MSIKEFKQLSRQNNYSVTQTPMQLNLSGHNTSVHDLIYAKFYDTLQVKRNSEILAVIPLTKKRNVAQFVGNPPKLSKPEFNLIKEFTHND